MLALIDMDLVCFRCSASAENDGAGIAIYRMNELMDGILEKAKATEYKAFLTGTKNFRKTIYPEYKANRTAPKPIYLQECRDYAISQMGAELAPEGLEADDSLGINQTDETIICSLDKDLLMIPGKHFQWAISGKNWEKPDTWIDQTYEEGMKLFYTQCITGDPSDNIKGIPGLGKAKAKTTLSGLTNERDMFDKVRRLYGNDEEFLMNARVLWIKRTLEEDFGDIFNAYI
tara:strand:+ start:346 stop:1038 length:693 start_codon:yes stop_codon:yes gene_type:complete